MFFFSFFPFLFLVAVWIVFENSVSNSESILALPDHGKYFCDPSITCGFYSPRGLNVFLTMLITCYRFILGCCYNYLTNKLCI